MITRFLLPGVFILNCFHGYTQSVKNESYLDFTIGPSIPVGAYAQKNIMNSSSGFANTGEFLKVSYVHLLSKSIGLTLSVHGQRNPLATKTLETSMSKAGFYQGVFAGSTPYPGPTQYSSYKYGNWKFDKNSWLFGSLLAGGYGEFSLNQSKNVLVTTKAMFGVVYVTAPEINGESTSDTAVAQIKQSGASAFGFAYLINGGLKLKLSNKLHLLTQVEYLGTSKLLFKNIETSFTTAHYTNGNPTSASSQTAIVSGKQQIASVNLNFGIGFIL